MISRSIITIFLYVVPLGAMQFSSADLIKELLQQPETTFTAEEKKIFKHIQSARKNASIMQLVAMKCDLNAMMLSKLGHPQYMENNTTDFFYNGRPTNFSHDEMISKLNYVSQAILTHLICKKIISCGKMTAYIGLACTFVYGVAVVIEKME